MDWLIIVGGVVFLLLGLVGCIFPAIPGPPIAYLSILLLRFTDGAGDEITNNVLIWTGLGVVTVTVLDFILPVWGTKKVGGTRAGRIGSTVGLIFGIFMGPAGIILGPFAGAVLGELIIGRSSKDAFRSGWGSFKGFLFGTLAKVVVTCVIAYYFVTALI